MASQRFLAGRNPQVSAATCLHQAYLVHKLMCRLRRLRRQAKTSRLPNLAELKRLVSVRSKAKPNREEEQWACPVLPGQDVVSDVGDGSSDEGEEEEMEEEHDKDRRDAAVFLGVGGCFARATLTKQLAAPATGRRARAMRGGLSIRQRVRRGALQYELAEFPNRAAAPWRVGRGSPQDGRAKPPGGVSVRRLGRGGPHDGGHT